MDRGQLLPVTDDDKRLLDELRAANGWSLAEVLHRAIRTIWTLEEQLQALQARHPGEVGDLIGRLRRDLPPELLVAPKAMRKVEEEGRQVRVRIDEFLCHVDADVPWVERRVEEGESERLEIYYARQGRLWLSNSGLISAPPDPDGVELT